MDEAWACEAFGVPPRGFDSRPPRLFGSSLGQRGLGVVPGACARGVGLLGRWDPCALVRLPFPLLGGIGKHLAGQNCLRVDSLEIDSINKNHDFSSYFCIQKPYHHTIFQQSVGYSAIGLPIFFSLRSLFIMRDAAANLKNVSRRFCNKKKAILVCKPLSSSCRVW